MFKSIYIYIHDEHLLLIENHRKSSDKKRKSKKKNESSSYTITYDYSTVFFIVMELEYLFIFLKY